MNSSVEPSDQAYGVPLFTELPPVPRVHLAVHGRQQHAVSGYLSLCRHALSIDEPVVRGAAAAVFIYDEVKRQSIDAAIVAAYFRFAEKYWVLLRSATRPPVEFREQDLSLQSESIEELGHRGLWEVPAGLIDKSLVGSEEPRVAARRELYEETGFELEVEELMSLGAAGYPCPGVIAEKQYFFSARIDEKHERKIMPLDGSPLESVGEVIALPLKQALLAIEAGLLQDLKSEVALTRLARFLGV